VRYFNGEIRLVADDLGSGGFGLPWGHQGVYSNRLSESYDFGNGYNWKITHWPYVVDDGDRKGVVFEPRVAFWFEEQASGSYEACFGAHQKFSHDAPNGLFILKFPDGHVWEFYDFTDPDHPGLFKKVTTSGGQTTQVYSYSDDQITEIRRSSGNDVESYLYSYSSGQIQCVTLRRSSNGGSSWTLLRRVAYTYYGAQETHGSLGDLKTATRQRYNGSSWVGDEVHYYRYYKSGQQHGFAHGLQYVVDPRATRTWTPWATRLRPATPR
jgi:hypothetical protein